MAESEAESVPSSSAHKIEIRNPLGVKTKEKEREKPSLSIIKFGESKRKKALIKFSVQHIFFQLPMEERLTTAKWHFAYKFVKTECKIVRNILYHHCFQEVHPNSSDFNLMWTGSHLKPHTLCGLKEFQKINHFPRSYELTRKDRLYLNIQKKQHSKGFKNFDFIPESYVLPAEYNPFFTSYAKQRGLWIVKPVASSRGRGIFLINHPNQVPLDDTLLVSKYIANPLLVDGFKFDLRLYVGVTSFDPLRIYLYEEGLTRFATVRYDQSNKNMKNPCMHLTNYSVNKKSEDYVSCNDPEIEDYGNKWSFGALLRFLKNKDIVTMDLVAKIEDLVVKTIIAGELPIATACKMFMPFSGNCFEIYGFDVLIDENLKPWLLEVNLSPSMACDAPMDLKIKSNLLTDMFNLTGFLAQDPLIKKVPTRKNVGHYVRNQHQRQRCHSAGLSSSRTLSSSSSNICSKTRQTSMENERGLTTEEVRVLRETKDEYRRRGSFVRIFPSPNSRELYGSYLEYRTTNNRMLSSRLFMEKSNPCTPFENNSSDKTMATYQYGQTLPERMICYERQLPSLGTEQRNKSPQLKDRVLKSDTKYPGQNSLTQGQLEVRSSEVVTSNEPAGQAVTAMKVSSVDHSHQTIHIDDVIEKAASLSKLQARKAFGMYLQRVKQRLVKEVSCDYEDSGDEDEKAKQDEQMNLVIRFLKKAAKNLRQEFKVVIPSRKLPMQDRRRILSQQLGDFVHIYDKETAQMKEKDLGHVGGENDSLSEKEFKKCLTMASESELEELLTEYTKVNNNASIFLGNSTSKPENSLKIFKPPLQRQTETKKHVRSHSAHALTTTNTQEVKMKQKSDQAFITRASDQNRRLAGAVAAYGKTLAINSMRKRPASANVSTERKRLSATSLVRPLSAKVSPNKPSSSTAVECDSSTNEKSVSDVLKKLARRQAVRQYEARLALSIETNKWVQPVGMVEKTVNNRDNGDSEKRGKVQSGLEPESRHSDADETFFTFVNYGSSSTHDHRKVKYEEQECKKAQFKESVRESSAVMPRAFSSSEIRIPCGESDVERKDNLGSARGEYNQHMQLLIERLAAHKFNKTNNEIVVPKPPSRSRSAKRPVSAQRMSRITSSHGSVI